MTGKEDLLAALIEAYLMERGTNEFYAKAAGKAVHAGARKAFGDLSAWEEKHMDFIQSLYQSVLDDRDMRGFDAFARATPSPLVEGGIPAKALEERITYGSASDDHGAVSLAMEIEGKAYNLYRKLAEGADDGNAAVVFREMMEQEMKHLDYLKTVKAHLAEAS